MPPTDTAAKPGCASGRRWLILGLLVVLPSARPEAATVLADHFAGRLVTLPGDATPVRYPDPDTWAFTFWPGITYPDSYGDGTNWLEGNAESQTYVTPFVTSIRGRAIPPGLRYDPFSIAADGLHIRASLLSAQQQSTYQVGGHRRFASGMLLSRVGFRYGTVRVVAKLPSARGAWPAFWLLPADHTWPPEIDLLEAMPWGPHRKEIHVGYVLARAEGRGAGAWKPLPFAPADEFHEYALTWTPQAVTYRADGLVLATYPTPPSMHIAMNLIINLAVGGTWAYNELKVGVTDSTDPARLERGASAVEADYPTEMTIRSVTVETAN